MVGIRGSIIGVGTDIGQNVPISQRHALQLTVISVLGGSIRVPSAFNFLYGIRPSHGRMPYGYMANSMEGQETVHSVVGPIAHSASGKLGSLIRA